ncbi:nuclear receptor subfamily 1 group I member 3-like isoform X2 [Babylonia areolata]
MDGVDLARVLTTMASIKPLLDPSEDSALSSSPGSTPGTSALSPQDHTYNTMPVVCVPSPSGISLQPDSAESSRKRVRLKDDKICGVCGDKALGFNFNAITCESCKAFFRRNAHKPKPECLFQGNCVIDVRTRRFCPSCRIHKCFAIGMNADMILDDAEKRARMERVVENRSKKLYSQGGTVTKQTFSPPSQPSRNTSEPVPTAKPIHSDTAIPAAMTSSVPLCTEEDTKPKMPLPSRQYGLPQTLQGRMFRHPPRELLPSDPQFYRRLTEDEKWILNDISTAFQATIATLNNGDTDPMPPNINPSLNELINSTDETVRQLIRFVGKVSDFQQMRKDDQISCLKNSVMQSVLLRSACVYILEKDVFLCSKGEIPTSYLQGALDNPALYTAHVNFCRSIKSIILNNYTMWALAQILALFNPCGNAILDREYMSSLQDKYIILLKHYLESEFAYTFAQDYMVALQDMLGDLKTLGEAYTTVIYNVNPAEIEPLLLEVFNLK